MALDFHLGKDLLDLAFRIDDVRAAHNAHFLLPVHRLCLPDAVCFERLVRGVSGQREVQLVLVVEFIQLLDGIAAHSENACAKFFQFFSGIPELVRLARSTRSVRLGEEIEHERPAAEILKAHFLSRVGGQAEIRRLVANVGHCSFLSREVAAEGIEKLYPFNSSLVLEVFT